MMYMARTFFFDKPSNEAARIIWALAQRISMEVFESKEAVLHCVKRIGELKRVCNRNNRGEKIELEWKDGSMHLYIACGKDLVADVWFDCIVEPCGILGIERLIDGYVHKESLTIFDQYLAEKEKGGAE